MFAFSLCQERIWMPNIPVCSQFFYLIMELVGFMNVTKEPSSWYALWNGMSLFVEVKLIGSKLN